VSACSSGTISKACGHRIGIRWDSSDLLSILQKVST
jgi:hypothetical protein